MSSQESQESAASEVVTERVPVTTCVQVPYQVQVCVPVCGGPW